MAPRRAPQGAPPDPTRGYLARRSRLRRALMAGLARLALAVVIIGGLFALVALGGDGSPDANGVPGPHTGAALSVMLATVGLGALIALAEIAVYLVRSARLARAAQTGSAGQWTQHRPRVS